MKSRALHHLDRRNAAFEGGLRRVVWIQTRRVADGGEDGGLGGGELRGGFSEIELRGGFGAEGMATKIGRVEVPLEDLRASEVGGDLGGKDAFTQGALERRRSLKSSRSKTRRCARVRCNSGLVRPASE